MIHVSFLQFSKFMKHARYDFAQKKFSKNVSFQIGPMLCARLILKLLPELYFTQSNCYIKYKY